jgi:maleylacetoacetate isomerase
LTGGAATICLRRRAAAQRRCDGLSLLDREAVRRLPTPGRGRGSARKGEGKAGKMIKLWGYFRSTAAYRVRIGLNLKGLAHERDYVHLAKGEHLGGAFKALNPQQLLPVLEVEEAGGRHVLIQSMAILEYLDETHPSPPFLPKGALARAQVRGIADIVACDIHPVNNLRVLKYLRGPMGQNEAAVNAWVAHWIAAGFEAIETLIEGEAFCFGDRPTLADICLVPQLFNARRFKVDLAPYPKICTVEKSCAGLAAFADAHPAKQPDAE